jgi:hypothetical protein
VQQVGRDSQPGWYPLRGSWEESVLTWNEQVDSSFRRRDQERTTAAKEATERAATTEVLAR